MDDFLHYLVGYARCNVEKMGVNTTFWAIFKHCDKVGRANALLPPLKACIRIATIRERRNSFLKLSRLLNLERCRSKRVPSFQAYRSEPIGPTEKPPKIMVGAPRWAFSPIKKLWRQPPRSKFPERIRSNPVRVNHIMSGYLLLPPPRSKSPNWPLSATSSNSRRLKEAT